MVSPQQRCTKRAVSHRRPLAYSTGYRSYQTAALSAMWSYDKGASDAKRSVDGAILLCSLIHGGFITAFANDTQHAAHDLRLTKLVRGAIRAKDHYGRQLLPGGHIFFMHLQVARLNERKRQTETRGINISGLRNGAVHWRRWWARTILAFWKKRRKREG